MSNPRRFPRVSTCTGSGSIGPTEVTLNTANATGDAFGRLRVSNPFTLFEFNSILGKQPLLIDESLTGGALSTFTAGNSYIELSVSGAGQRAIRQSHEYILYQPGKSKLVYMTGVLYRIPSAISQLTCRIGCYDADFGIFLQQQNGTLSVVKRNGGTDIETVPQEDWADPLSDVDFSKAQIFWFDFEWLGVGQVRCGIVQNGVYRTYYTFRHADQLVAPYIPMAKLPLRYEIESTGSTNSMRMICGTVVSEGGFSPMGNIFTSGNFTAKKTVDRSDITKFTPLFALRVRSAFPYNRTTVKLRNVDIFNNTANTSGAWQVLLNPTVGGVGITWADYDSTSSAVQVATGLPAFGTITGGTLLYSGFYSTRDNSTIYTSTDELVAATPITTGLSGTPDVIVLVANAYTTGSDPDLFTSVTWIELI